MIYKHAVVMSQQLDEARRETLSGRDGGWVYGRV